MGTCDPLLAALICVEREKDAPSAAPPYPHHQHPSTAALQTPTLFLCPAASSSLGLQASILGGEYSRRAEDKHLRRGKGILLVSARRITICGIAKKGVEMQMHDQHDT